MKANKRILSVALEYSPSPGGRTAEDGKYPADKFRDTFLVPIIAKYPNEQIVLDLDGGEGYGTSFLEETFGGLVRLGYSKEQIYHTFEIKSALKSDLRLIEQYIADETVRQNARK